MISCQIWDVSNDVSLQTCVAETKKTVLVVTSDLRLPPRGMMARLTFCALRYIGHTTLDDAFGPAGDRSARRPEWLGGD